MKKIKCSGLFVLCFVFFSLVIGPLPCGQEVKAAEVTPEIVWMFPCGSSLKDLDKVTVEINKYIKPKIGATLKLKPVGWDKWILPETQDSAYDIKFTASWSNFESDAVKGELLALNAFIDKYMPKTKAIIKGNLLGGATRMGRLYGLPVIRDNIYVAGVKLRKDLVTKYRIDTSKIKKLQDLEPVLKNIKAREKNVNILEIGDNYFNGFLSLDALGDEGIPGVISNEGSEMKVTDAFSYPQTKIFFKTLYNFRKAGLLSDSQDIGQDESQGKVFAILKGRMPLYDSRYEFTKKGLEWVNIPLGKAYINTYSATGSMNAIAADSKKPEKALALLELVNTDKYLNNLINFGIEKNHYIKINANTIDFTNMINSGNSRYFSDLRWISGNMYLNYLWRFEDPAMLQKMKSLNDTAVPSKGLGFWFNKGGINTKTDNCMAIYNDYMPGLMKGMTDPEKVLSGLEDKLGASGAGDVIKEKQRQLDAWIRNKKELQELSQSSQTSSLFSGTNGKIDFNKTTVVEPPESNAVIINPGKGWVLYGEPSDQSFETISKTAVGFTRWDWSDIEPQEGVYNWDIIDTFIAKWKAVGKKSGFGVMCANVGPTIEKSYVTPEWVFDAGAKSTTAYKVGSPGTAVKQIIPVWDDAIFMEKMEKFINTLGRRYDGNTDLEFIDIRSYGNFGEGHVSGLVDETNGISSKTISSEVLREHIRVYREAFKKTQLILPWGEPKYNADYDWAVQQGIGIRRDGIMGKYTGYGCDGSECTRAFGYEPSVYEFFYSYADLAGNVHSDASWDANKLEQYVDIGKPSYIGMGGYGKDAQIMMTKEQKLIDELANKMGYHFVLKKAVLPDFIKSGEKADIELDWMNKGVSPVYEDCYLAIALIDSANSVKGICWIDSSKPSSWIPGILSENKAEAAFNVPPGRYALGIGLFKSKTDIKPNYKIGNKTLNANGWYLLKAVDVVD